MRASGTRLAAGVAGLLLIGTASVAATIVVRGVDAVPGSVPTLAKSDSAGHPAESTADASVLGDLEGSGRVGGITAQTLRAPDGRGPSYATDRPAGGSATTTTPPPVPMTTDDYADPNAVVIRVPDRDYGSGYHGDYGAYHRETSPAQELAEAATAANSCLIIGDSIATFVVKDLVAELRRTSGETCVYDTWPGRATEGTANALLDIKRHHGLPPKVIVMSGTNDIFNPPLFETQMNRIVDGIGPGHEILWVSTFDSRRPASVQSHADERNTAWINDVLQRRAAHTPSLRIVRWDSLFRGDARNVDTLLSDGVHPNEAGIEAMVHLVRSSLTAADTVG